MRVFIQNEAGSRTKHLHDEKSLELKGRVDVSRAYPFPYGFVLGTTADDGCHVDCFVLTRHPLRTGEVVTCDPVALMEQVEDGREDHNVLAVRPGEQIAMDAGIAETLTDFVSHVFDHVAGKDIRVGAFLDRDAAMAFVRRHRDADQASLEPVEFRTDFCPTAQEIGDLQESVGWTRSDEDYPAALSGYSSTVSAHDSDGRLIGWTAVVSDNVRHAFLVDVMVHPAWQRRGVGTRLVRRAVDVTKRRGVTQVHVDCAPKYTSFYEGCGFTIGAGGWLDQSGSD